MMNKSFLREIHSYDTYPFQLGRFNKDNTTVMTACVFLIVNGRAVN